LNGAITQVHLVVVKPFGTLARGDIVTDSMRIMEILNSEHAHAVVRVAVSSNKGA
jgi:hypothetical protein